MKENERGIWSAIRKSHETVGPNKGPQNFIIDSEEKRLGFSEQGPKTFPQTFQNHQADTFVGSKQTILDN